MSEEMSYQVIKLIEQDPEISQRELSKKTRCESGQGQLLPACADGQGLGQGEELQEQPAQICLSLCNYSAGGAAESQSYGEFSEAKTGGA